MVRNIEISYNERKGIEIIMKKSDAGLNYIHMYYDYRQKQRHHNYIFIKTILSVVVLFIYLFKTECF